MSKSTVKPGMTPRRAKRAKRAVENDQFDAFVRRILRAYARRVAAGDIEALAMLTMLSSEVDSVLRDAVRGLRKTPYSYSWDEIGQRLGTSRQAAQMRFGVKSDRPTLDRRITEAGMGVTVTTLVEVFADHFPGSPVPTMCPACGYRYPLNAVDCPTNATVRPLLFKRRAEDEVAVARLTGAQLAFLRDPKSILTDRRPVRQKAPTASCPDRTVPNLFDLIGKDPTS
ncbi:hypothetical protein [Dactylosporangium sp. NPDC049140]|uniref:hypothetical protein n=1 Tax=Dactylosporangium sp. NPDC049140 TaxID=3155647 RepID=UPI0033C6A039